MAEATLEHGGDTASTGMDVSERPRAPAARHRYGWLLGRELMVIATIFLAYRTVRLLVKDEFGEAFRNANRVIDWERTLGIFNEVSLQGAILSNDAVIWVLNRYYFFGHFAGAILLLTWMYIRHFERYGRVRRVMAIMTIVGLTLHVAFPLAPPRWFPRLGFVDTLQTFGPKIYDSETVTATANQIAAMPSLHVGWAMCGAWAVIIASRSRWRWLVVTHPVVMTLAVVLTANHWWLDALVAAVIFVVAVWVDRPIQGWLERREQRRIERRRAGADGPGVAADDQIELVNVA